MSICFISFYNTFGINSKLLQHPLYTRYHLSFNMHFYQSILRKQPSRGVRKKRCFGNMQQIYRRNPCQSVISKCDVLEFRNESFGRRVEWVGCTIFLLSQPARKINIRFYLIKDFDVIYVSYHLLNACWKYSTVLACKKWWVKYITGFSNLCPGKPITRGI